MLSSPFCCSPQSMNGGFVSPVWDPLYRHGSDAGPSAKVSVCAHTVLNYASLKECPLSPPRLTLTNDRRFWSVKVLAPASERDGIGPRREAPLVARYPPFSLQPTFWPLHLSLSLSSAPSARPINLTKRARACACVCSPRVSRRFIVLNQYPARMRSIVFYFRSVCLCAFASCAPLDTQIQIIPHPVFFFCYCFVFSRFMWGWWLCFKISAYRDQKR